MDGPGPDQRGDVAFDLGLHDREFGLLAVLLVGDEGQGPPILGELLVQGGQVGELGLLNPGRAAHHGQPVHEVGRRLGRQDPAPLERRSGFVGPGSQRGDPLPRRGQLRLEPVQPVCGGRRPRRRRPEIGGDRVVPFDQRFELSTGDGEIGVGLPRGRRLSVGRARVEAERGGEHQGDAGRGNDAAWAARVDNEGTWGQRSGRRLGTNTVP